MYSHILVAVDGSPNSEHALDHAIGLAKGLSATLCIVHVADMGWLPLGPELAIDIDALLKARRAAADHILAAARECVQAALGRGEALKILVEEASDEPPG